MLSKAIGIMTWGVFLMSVLFFGKAVGEFCLPQCCPSGQSLDDNFECKADMNHLIPIECPSQPFYPRCVTSDLPEKRIFPSPIDVNATQITNSLGKFEMRVPGTGYTLQTFYDIDERVVPTNSGNGNSSRVLHQFEVNRRQKLTIPSSFCVDDRKALMCPRTRFDRAKILKCCPFGEEVKFPLVNEAIECVPSEPRPGQRWEILLNGYPFRLQDLIRFPYENVFHDFREPLSCKASEEQLVFDYSAFVVNQNGQLSFTRLLNGETLSNKAFCVDMASLLPEVPASAATLPPIVEVPRPRLHLMMALFCVPKQRPIGTIREDLLDVLAPSKSGQALLANPGWTRVWVYLVACTFAKIGSSQFETTKP